MEGVHEVGQNYYGVNTEDSYYKAVTDAWDSAQEEVSE
mgnify:CR=1 FL=1